MWEIHHSTKGVFFGFGFFLFLVLIGTSAAHGAAFSLVSQDRSVTATVGDDVGVIQSISDNAPDAGVFDVNYSVSFDYGSANVQQLSSIESTILSVYLSASGYGAGYPLGWGSANTNYEVTFTLDVFTEVKLLGNLIGGGTQGGGGSGSAITSLLDSENLEIFNYGTIFMLSIDETFNLSPGQYTYTVTTNGGGGGYYAGSGSGMANIQLQIIPEPFSFTILLVGGLMGLRYRKA